MLEIVVDVHEKPSRIPALLTARGASVKVRALTRGDYVVGPDCLIERKTVVDLHLTVGQGRFWHQMHGLRSVARPYLLVEGRSLWLPSGGLAPDSIRGLLLAAGDLGVRVIRSDDRADSTAWILRLADRCRRASVNDRPVYSQRPRRSTSIPAAEQAVAAAPGISTVTARALLEQFGSLRNITSATKEELQTVEGVGLMRAKALHSMIHDEWDPDQVH